MRIVPVLVLISFIVMIMLTGCVSNKSSVKEDSVIAKTTPTPISEPITPQLTADEWNTKGNDFSIKKQYDEAINAYNKAIELDPNHYYAWLNKGVNYRYSGKYNEAIQIFDSMIQKYPEDATPLYEKALILESQGKNDEADRLNKMAYELDLKMYS